MNLTSKLTKQLNPNYHIYYAWKIQSRTKNVGQCFFANVNWLVLSMVTMKIFIYLLEEPRFTQLN
jgi:hypothetical protein